MGVIAATATGLSRALGSPRIVLCLWLLNLLVALPAAVAIGESIRESVGHSLADEGLRSGLDLGWYGEFYDGATELERTFRPSVVGVGALLDNLESWFSGEMFSGHRGIVALGLVWALLWTLLIGGVLEQVSRARAGLTFGTVLAKGAGYFWRMLRLGVFSGVLYYWIYRFARKLFPWIEDATRDVTAERTVLVYNLLGAVLILLLFFLVRLSFDYAKIAVVRENRRSAVLAALRGVGFVLSNPRRTLGTGLVFVVLGLGLTLVYAGIAPGAGQSGWWSLLAAFFVGQALLVLKLGLRVALLGAESAVYSGRSRDTIPRPL